MSRSSVAIYGGVALLCIFCDLFLPERIGLLASATLFLAWSTWLVRTDSRRAPLIIDPLVCFQAWFGLTIGVASVYTAIAESEPTLAVGGFRISYQELQQGHAIMTAGAWALYAGLTRFAPARGLSRLPNLRLGTLAVAALIGTVATLFQSEATLLLGVMGGGLRVLALAAVCLFALRGNTLLRVDRQSHLVTLLIAVAGLLLLATRTDSKSDVVFSFLPLLWYAAKKASRLVAAACVMSLAIAYVIVISPLVGLARLSKTEAGAIALTSASSGAALEAMEGAYSTDRTTYLLWSIDAVMSRICEPRATGMAVALVHRSGFLWGEGLDYVPLALIPRALWREKPLIERGKYFTVAIGAAEDVSTATTSTGQTAAGELYWNFGWPGVLVGMYVLGATIAGLWWRVAGGDASQGIVEMTAYTGAMTYFVVGVGCSAGGAWVTALSVGLFWRGIVVVRNFLRRRSFRSGNGVAALPPTIPRYACNSV